MSAFLAARAGRRQTHRVVFPTLTHISLDHIRLFFVPPKLFYRKNSNKKVKVLSFRLCTRVNLICRHLWWKTMLWCHYLKWSVSLVKDSKTLDKKYVRESFCLPWSFLSRVFSCFFSSLRYQHSAQCRWLRWVRFQRR